LRVEKKYRPNQLAIPKGRTVWGHPVAVGPSKEFVSVLIRERERERERERDIYLP